MAMVANTLATIGKMMPIMVKTIILKVVISMMVTVLKSKVMREMLMSTNTLLETEVLHFAASKCHSYT